MVGILLIFWTSCHQQNIASVSTISTTASISETITPTPSPLSPVSSAPISPTSQSYPVASAWAGFTYALTGEAFLYLEDPQDWQVSVYPSTPRQPISPTLAVFPRGKFFYPTHPTFTIRVDNFAVNLAVFYRSPEDWAATTPHQSAANSQGETTVLWEKPIQQATPTGLMYILGSPDIPYSSIGFVQLQAVYYDEKNEIGIALKTNIDQDSLLIAETEGFTTTIAQRFQVFEHMANSVRVFTREWDVKA